MARLLLPFGSYEHRARQVSCRRLVNCYAEQLPPLGKSPLVLMRAPGIRSFATLPSGVTRGMCVHNGELYVVGGGSLYKVGGTGAVSTIGSVSANGRVSMASNGFQLVVVCAPYGYVYNASTASLTQIADEDFTDYGAAGVAMLDSFALFVAPGTGIFFCSNYLDATAYDGFGYATAEGAPDNLVSLLVDHRQIFLFGTESTEVWYNSGGDPVFPFSREPSGFIEIGCGAAASPAKADNAVFWLDNLRIARRLVDYVPTRISTHAVEQKWSGYSTVADAAAFTFALDGHWFYSLNFPTAGDTWIYDIATGEWHERRSRTTAGEDGAWRVAAGAYCYGLNIVGDSASSAIGVVDPETYTEWGNPLRMEWTYPSVYADGLRAFHHRLEINVQAGVGLATGQGAAPQLMLYKSDDGGMTFDALPSRSIGGVGEYRNRAVWNRLGQSRDRVYRAAVSDPVPVTVFGTRIEVDGGRL